MLGISASFQNGKQLWTMTFQFDKMALVVKIQVFPYLIIPFFSVTAPALLHHTARQMFSRFLSYAYLRSINVGFTLIPEYIRDLLIYSLILPLPSHQKPIFHRIKHTYITSVNLKNTSLIYKLLIYQKKLTFAFI